MEVEFSTPSLRDYPLLRELLDSAFVQIKQIRDDLLRTKLTASLFFKTSVCHLFASPAAHASNIVYF